MRSCFRINQDMMMNYLMNVSTGITRTLKYGRNKAIIILKYYCLIKARGAEVFLSSSPSYTCNVNMLSIIILIKLKLYAFITINSITVHTNIIYTCSYFGFVTMILSLSQVNLQF